MKLLILLTAICSSHGMGFGGDDRFMRKYAMMKVYESCLGPDVVKEVRKEMKIACAKCASGGGQNVPLPPPPMMDVKQPQFDPVKLQQAIMGFKQAQQQQHLQQQIPSQLRPYPSNSFYQAAQPLYYPASNNLYNTPAMFAPPGYYTPAAAGQYYQPQPQPQYYPGYYPVSQRESRDFELRSQLESLTSRIGGRVKNITCVMQELGYLDENLQPNYMKIVDRINKLPVSEELKKDMTEGVEFCRQFSQCVPESKKERFPMSRDIMKPMFFFRCYKHKKLEACVMKDIRERYAQNEDIPVEESENGPELRSLPGMAEVDKEEFDDVATSMYEFLYGAGNFDVDSM